MKRTIIAAILGVAGSVATTYGQGITLFNNYISQNFNPVVYGAGVAGHAAGANVNNGNVELALFYVLGNVSGDTTSQFLTAAGSAVGTTFIDTTANQGSGFGGTGNGGYYDDGTTINLAGWNTSSTATFMVEAWDSTSGGTFSTPGNLVGESALWTEVVDPQYAINATDGGYGILPSSASVPEPMANGMPTLTMTTSAVPEPTTLALAGLGGLASLMAFRRKQV
jgi:hypothetical protein